MEEKMKELVEENRKLKQKPGSNDSQIEESEKQDFVKYVEFIYSVMKNSVLDGSSACKRLGELIVKSRTIGLIEEMREIEKEIFDHLPKRPDNQLEYKFKVNRLFISRNTYFIFKQ